MKRAEAIEHLDNLLDKLDKFTIEESFTRRKLMSEQDEAEAEKIAEYLDAVRMVKVDILSEISDLVINKKLCRDGVVPC